MNWKDKLFFIFVIVFAVCSSGFFYYGLDLKHKEEIQRDKTYQKLCNPGFVTEVNHKAGYIVCMDVNGTKKIVDVR
jgi:glutathione synthase/RimK-type ligase-like ATP-grasp enzyme